MNMLIYANIFNRLAQNYQPIKPRDARMLRTHCYVLNRLTMRIFVQFLLFYMETFVMGEGRQVLLKKRMSGAHTVSAVSFCEQRLFD